MGRDTCVSIGEGTWAVVGAGVACVGSFETGALVSSTFTGAGALLAAAATTFVSAGPVSLSVAGSETSVARTTGWLLCTSDAADE